MMQRLRTSFLTALVLVVSTLVVSVARAEDSTAIEYRVKAVCLYNFAKYVKWPDAAFAKADTPINLCILGTNPFGELFNDVQGKTAQNRRSESWTNRAATRANS